MLTIAWYNVVAIIVAIIALWLTKYIPDDFISQAWYSIIWVAAVLIFYAIWGGIFWW